MLALQRHKYWGAVGQQSVGSRTSVFVSLERRGESVQPRPSSRERRAKSVEPRPSSREHIANSVEPRPSSRERRAKSVEPRPSSRERRAKSVEPRPSSRERGLAEVDRQCLLEFTELILIVTYTIRRDPLLSRP